MCAFALSTTLTQCLAPEDAGCKLGLRVKLRTRPRWQFPLAFQLEGQQVDVIESGFSCLHTCLDCVPLIANIRLTVQKCVGSVLRKILPLTLHFSSTRLLKRGLNLPHFEMPSMTFISQPHSAMGVKGFPAGWLCRKWLAPRSTRRGHCSHSLHGLGLWVTNPVVR